MKNNTQVCAKLLPSRSHQRETQEWLEVSFDRGHKSRRDLLRGFGGEVEPDFREVIFGRVSYTEGERAANSFLPRSTILLVSKSLTRPAATSARPLSISAWSAAIS